MKTYELTYIVSPEITSEEAETKAKEIESLVQSKEGIILKQTNPSAKTLAYPIKKSASGFMGVLEFQMEEEKLSEIQANMVKDEKIVRQMLVVKNPIKPRKERRTRVKTEETFKLEKKTEEIKEPEQDKPSAVKEKVELKDIEQTLDELLGE